MGSDEHHCVIGIDIGGSEMRAAGVDSRGNILFKVTSPSPAHDNQLMIGAFEDILKRTISKSAEAGYDVRAVGIAAAGYIDQSTGVVVAAPNIGWKNAPLRQVAADATGLPSFLDNDANCAAAGERSFGVARGVDNLVCLTLGTGVGGGVYAQGALLRGNRGMAAELGHMVIDRNSFQCGCGRKGCFEVLASGTALGRIARRLASEEPETLLMEMAEGDPGNINGEMVSEAAEKRDQVALRAYDEWSKNLAEGIVDLIHAFDPEMVVLGGGVSESGHLFIDKVRREVLETGNEYLVKGVLIELTELGEDAGILGAAALAWEGIAEGDR